MKCNLNVCYWGLAKKKKKDLLGCFLPFPYLKKRVPTAYFFPAPSCCCVFAWRWAASCPVVSVSHGPPARQLVCAICAAPRVKRFRRGVVICDSRTAAGVNFVYKSTERRRCPGVDRKHSAAAGERELWTRGVFLSLRFANAWCHRAWLKKKRTHQHFGVLMLPIQLLRLAWNRLFPTGTHRYRLLVKRDMITRHWYRLYIDIFAELVFVLPLNCDEKRAMPCILGANAKIFNVWWTNQHLKGLLPVLLLLLLAIKWIVSNRDTPISTTREFRYDITIPISVVYQCIRHIC